MGKSLNKGEKALYLTFIADQYVRGYSYRTIVKNLEQEYNQSISLMTVSRYVKKLITEWKDERISKLDDMKTVELQRIHRLEQTYWEGWERSLEASTRSSEKQKARPKVNNGETSMDVHLAEKATYTEETNGDPRFLAGVQWCISMRCKIIGIEAPIQFEGKVNGTMKHTTVFKTRVRVRPAE